MEKDDYKTLIAGGDTRLTRELHFNLRLFADIHPDRLAKVPGMDEGLWRRLAASDAVVRRLSRDLSWLGLEGDCSWVPLPAARHRLAFMPWPELRKGLYWFGMAVHFQAVKQCVSGAEIRQLTNVAGPEARAFALERGGLMVGKRVRGLFPDNPELPLPERVEWAVVGALAGCLSDASEALKSRFRVVLPPVYEKRMATIRQLNDGERRVLWSGVHKILAREALPEWASFFS